LHLTWAEKAGAAVKEPQRKGFGSRLIESAVTRELGGRASVRYAAAGVIVELQVPLQADPGPTELEDAAA
jgi:two-component sensor histidine kinase